ncbi:putative leucine-rich repeat-containing protein DDB_G0290503 isoform X2 [Coccinella septempunctata]|uniref:putative leucine-rich repeat-containing protein DDB_G0290503 isoform X2 n=1 Tax=Coccinella septempunctata TaxID=41139 RepID=UPI001D070D07|nr:putative leucine-rich repeat-containing protein DDB_G0290503 isoform X2 [Coccinella septempunctata]
MENNLDSSAVPSLNIVVEEIFSSCTKTGRDVIPASTLIEFMKPHMSDHLIGLAQLRYVLDPNNENPLINRPTFYEAMRRWTAKMNESDSKLLNISFKDTDVFDGNVIPFHRSTPKPSLEPTAMKNSNDSLDFSNLSPTSFTTNTKDNSIGMDKLLFIEERYQELEHKHLNTIRELALLRTQLAASEEQYSELKQDLDRTNKRLMLEQQVNADLQKSMEHNDDFREEVCNTKKEKDHLHRMWLLTKRENVNLIAQIKDLEYEREVLDRKLGEMQRKDEQKKKEFFDLQTLFALYEDENKLLKKSKVELEEKLQETKASLEHYTEVSEILKNKVQALTTAYKKKGIELNEPILEKNPSNLSNSSGIPNSPFLSHVTSSTPLKKLQHSWRRDFDLFTSPKLQRQLSSPITPGGLDTPQFLKNALLFNKSANIQENSRDCILKDSLYDPKRMLGTNSSKSGRSKNLPPVRSSGESVDIEEKRCFSEKAENSLQSENSMFETMEDLDLSSFSDHLRTFNGQDLLSELQECKFLDNHNKCFIEEHAELLKAVKEHENCSQIIANKDKEIESIAAEFKAAQHEYNIFFSKYKNLENDIKRLEEQLRSTKMENEELINKNDNYIFEITNLKKDLDTKFNELQKMIVFKSENHQLMEEIDELKDKRERDIEKYSEIRNENEHLQSTISKLIKENDDLFNEKNNLYSENNKLNSLIEIKEKELNEMNNLKIRNKELEEEVKSTKLDLEQNCEEVKILSNKLLTCRNNGKYIIEKLNTKIKEQNSKIEFLENFSKKLQEYVKEIESTIDTEKKRLNMLMSYVEENFVNVKYVHKGDDEDSTSTGSSESSAHHRSKRSSTSGKKSSYEKQQLKINKLEEKIEELKKQLYNEKAINEDLKNLEYQMNNLEMEKISLQEEKSSVLRELEALKYDLSMKDQMMKQFEEKRNFDLENLNQSYEKEIELTRIAQKKTQMKEISLMEEIEELKKQLNDALGEKRLFETILGKQEDKIITLKKALSDISTSTEETKNFEILVTEKESMLKFNRELLLKSNNSLKQAENRCLFLELLLDKCKMVLLETVNDVLRSTIEVFNSYRNILEEKRVDPELFIGLEILETKSCSTVDDFTEKEIWNAQDNLLLTSKLLKAMVSVIKDHSECSHEKDTSISKSVSKFTLRPSKLQLNRFPSRDPDISSSSTKDNEQGHTEDAENDELIEKMELRESEKKGSIDNLRENDSDNWLGPYCDVLREEMNNRKVTEKKFTVLSATWKSNFENTKQKYRGLKRRCTKMRDTYLHALLQIVTYIKNHHCHQEQKTLIQALKYIEKLKDLLFDVFKLAEQYGASRQELHSIKCWNLIVEYVNRLHQENGLLKLYQCTSVQITDAPNTSADNCEETTELKKSFRSVGVGDSIIDEQNIVVPSLPINTKRRKCSSGMMMISTIMGLIAMCIIFIHMECIRNGNDTIMCPLDFFVAIKRAPTGH